MTGLNSSRIKVLLAMSLVLLVSPLDGFGQEHQDASSNWSTPRTEWGAPDLQGVWTTDGERSVPFERPDSFGERDSLTSEELAERADREATSLADDKTTRNRRDGDPEAGPEHWYEFGKYTSERTSLIIDPPDGKIPTMTIGAKTRYINPSSRLGFVGGSMGGGPYNGPEDLHLADRCITRGLPQTWYPSAYNNGFQIVQSPGYVAVLYERLHEHRIIPVDGRNPINSSIGQWFGDSRGRWEGDTLVVEVTNFSDQTNFRGSGSTRRLIERYTRVDQDTVRVSITIDDPTTWTQTWTTAITGKRDPDYWQVFEYACHEGNYGMTNILSAARNLEKQARGSER